MKHSVALIFALAVAGLLSTDCHAAPQYPLDIDLYDSYLSAGPQIGIDIDGYPDFELTTPIRFSEPFLPNYIEQVVKIVNILFVYRHNTLNMHISYSFPSVFRFPTGKYNSTSR